MAREAILIIVNPTSGRRRALRVAEQVAAYLKRRDRDAAIRYTRARGDAERLVQEACISQDDQPGCVVACGGDGTVQEVANALAPLQASPDHEAPVMGLAPAGRCNDFARALGITAGPVAIAKTLADGVPYAIDLGKVNERYFCTVATLGVDAEVTSYVDAMRLPLRGTLAYVYGAIRVIRRYRAHDVHLTGDFGTIEQSIFLASSANTSSYGGAIPIAPGASPTDGKLNLCIVDRVSRLRAFLMLPMVMLGRHRNQPDVHFIHTEQFTVEAKETLEIWADGERIGTTPAKIEVAPGALRVLLPRSNHDVTNPACVTSRH